MKLFRSSDFVDQGRKQTRNTIAGHNRYTPNC